VIVVSVVKSEEETVAKLGMESGVGRVLLVVNDLAFEVAVLKVL
jgi:hypothetical protein